MDTWKWLRNKGAYQCRGRAAGILAGSLPNLGVVWGGGGWHPSLRTTTMTGFPPGLENLEKWEKLFQSGKMDILSGKVREKSFRTKCEPCNNDDDRDVTHIGRSWKEILEMRWNGSEKKERVDEFQTRALVSVEAALMPFWLGACQIWVVCGGGVRHPWSTTTTMTSATMMTTATWIAKAAPLGWKSTA